MSKNILFRPRKELECLQNRKLRYFITRHLYPFSPYYRGLFDKNKIKPDDIKTVDDLKRIPFSSKNDFLGSPEEDIRERSLEFFLRPTEESVKKYLPKAELVKLFLRGRERAERVLESEYRPVFLTATAGTTNKPISFIYTGYDIENLKIYGKRLIEILDIRHDGRVLNAFPYAPHLAFWQTVFAGLSANIFVLSTGGGKTLGTEGNIHSILNVKPQFLIGVPSYVYHILKTARGKNLDLNFLTRIALGAGRVPKGFKKKISKLLAEMGARGVMVLGTYGFTESRCAWVECPTPIEISSGYHTYPDKEVFEVIDPGTGEVKAEGEDGEIVYTGIDARGSCVLRYRTGDLVKGGIAYSPCPHCGRTVPRISSNIVRASNIKNVQLSKIKGTLVNLNDLEHILDNIEEIDDWQIEIIKKDNDPYEVDQLILYVSLLYDLNKDELAARIKQEISCQTEVSFNQVNFISSEEIQNRIEIETALKAKKITDKRPKV
jgi:phenylacetate-coenzyme A ligase PaaK-like adenylate-forming protein